MSIDLFSCRGALALILYTVYMWLADVLRFIALYLGVALPLKGFLGAGLLLFAAVFIYGRRRGFQTYGPSDTRESSKGWLHPSLMLVFLLIFTALYIIKGAFPDISEDVTKYHVLLQEPVLRDMTGSDLFPGSFQGFGFPLPDRLFHPFRMLLGYRGGTVLNLICVVIVFCQTDRILQEFSGGLIRRLSPVFAFVITCQYDMLLQVSTYMVELHSLVLILESIYLLIRDEPEEGIGDRSVFFAFLQGLIFASKMTNVIYVLPLILLYIIKNRRYVKLPLFLACTAAGVLPVSIYLLHNFIMTGNPVFPYYNLIFDSPYFPDMDFRDERWGGKSLIEKLLWPMLLIFEPDNAKSELPNPYTYGMLAAWIGTALYLIMRAVKAIRALGGKLSGEADKGIKAMDCLFIFTLSCSLLWSFTTGHSRYYMAGSLSLMLLGVMATGYILRDAAPKVSLKKTVLPVFISGALILIMLPGPFISAKKTVMSFDWRGTMPISDRVTWKQYLMPLETGAQVSRKRALFELYKDNWSQLGRDKSFTVLPYDERSEQKNIKPDVFVLFDYASMPAVLYDPEIPIISWRYITEYPDGELFIGYADMMEEMLSEHTAAAIIGCPKGRLPELSLIYGQRFDIDQVIPLSNNIDLQKDYYIVYLKNPPERICDYEQRIPLSLIGEEPVEIGYADGDTDSTEIYVDICGPDSFPWEELSGSYQIDIYIDDGYDGEEEQELRLLYSMELDPKEKSGALELDLSGKKGVLYASITHEGRPEDKKQDAEALAIASALGTEPVYPYAAWISTDLTGLQCINGSWYQLSKDREARSGWIEEDGSWFYGSYFGELSTGWDRINDVWYYFNEDGSMETGWIDVEGKRYYLREDGSMVTGTVEIDGSLYSFDESGALIG